jgi:hypothetical protein
MPLSTGGGWPDPVQEGRGGGGGRHRGWWMQQGEESRNTAGEGEAAESRASANEIFFHFTFFFNHYSRNESGETFFPNLSILSRVNPSDMTYEGVTSVHLVRLKGLVYAQSSRWSGWCHVVSVTPVRSARLVFKSHQFI